MLNRLFHLDQYRTTARREIAAGVTTYLTMAYIVVVNPQILGEAGMDRGAVFVATCLAAAIACAAMGLYANYPIAHGIAAGFITCTAIKLLSGRFKQLRPAVAALAVVFVVKIVLLGT